ncbi:MAG TPA: TonB family protein [Opitutaceae bacterium]|nr:TonB family protein [Opitutaceae bacterium]HRE08665.1 TonB family protein [Opitutaceae bacterium]
MNRDLIIGLLLSGILHGGFLFGEQLFPKAKSSGKKVSTEDATVELMQMPPPEPEEVEPTETEEPQNEEVADLAPPMAADVPATVTVESFVQKLQPPPPPGLNRPTGVISIPTGRPNTGGIGKGMKDLFDLANLDQVPSPRFQAKPVYPFEMRRAGITGDVLVGFIVDSNGDVREAYAIKSTQREFEAAAIQAVSKWKFRPGKKGGRAVNTRMQVPIVFSITEE